jgi:hypothetical protein
MKQLVFVDPNIALAIDLSERIKVQLKGEITKCERRTMTPKKALDVLAPPFGAATEYEQLTCRTKDWNRLCRKY